MKTLTVLGARPQFVKASVVSAAFARQAGHQEVLVHTGQHFDANMSAVFFDELGIPRPDHTLDIHSLPHGAMTGRMLEALEQLIEREAPDWVLVYGDTNSTLAGALAAAKLHVPVAHVEAGLRSFNRRMPEEVNRVMTDHLSDRLFVPTQAAITNLTAEGITGDKVINTGDVMFDCARRYGQLASERSQILSSLALEPGGFILCTAHRAENTDSPELLRTLFDTLNALSAQLPVVLPLHPRTRALALAAGIALPPDATAPLIITEPVGYLDMVRLEQAAALILTDSGGVQKEAFFHQVPCLTLRPETEWVELVDSGWNRLSPLSNGSEAVVSAALAQLGRTGQPVQPYGDGNAADLIVHSLGDCRS
ncbi:MAG: non-hydrolyzing UDP-N-acetylglucosamine 2-epimerase [Burkholderiaceae bacterium]